MEILLITMLYLIASKGTITLDFTNSTSLYFSIRRRVNIIPSINYLFVCKLDYIQIENMTLHRKYRQRRTISWLLFEFCFNVKVLSDVGKLFPPGYKQSEDPFFQQRYDALCKTDFFN